MKFLNQEQINAITLEVSNTQKRIEELTEQGRKIYEEKKKEEKKLEELCKGVPESIDANSKSI